MLDIGAEVQLGKSESDSDNQNQHTNSENEQAEPKYKTASTQTQSWPMFCVEKFQNDPEGLAYYTGLENYKKFLFVLQSLGSTAYHLKYYYKQVECMSVENQFFLTLIKLRRAKDNFELSRLFEISEATVTNIFITWVNFLYRQWKQVDLWPERDVVKFYMPSDFKQKFPSTRVVVDGTEVPIQKPSAPLAQQATFSTYKNKNTAKILVGATPGGLVSYISEAYGGSTSDRQIVERSNLISKCDPNDSVMADKGFNVQDLFAPQNVTVNIPSFLSKKNRLSGDTVMKDRKIASKRVHIERIIGLAKSYSILKSSLNATETKLATEITFICFMLVNFRSCIVPKDA